MYILTYEIYLYTYESESEVAQSCPTLCDPMDCSLSGFCIHGIFQARVLGIEPMSPTLQADALSSEPPGKCVYIYIYIYIYLYIYIYIYIYLYIYIRERERDTWACSVAKSYLTICNPMD